LTTNINFFKKELKNWYKKNRRSFEWRDSSNPWKILLIETLSQQTQIDRADEFYKKFIRKYPTPKDMAKDSKKEVLKLWSGLGYNNRAIDFTSLQKYYQNIVLMNYIQTLQFFLV